MAKGDQSLQNNRISQASTYLVNVDQRAPDEPQLPPAIDPRHRKQLRGEVVVVALRRREAGGLRGWARTGQRLLGKLGVWQVEGAAKPEHLGKNNCENPKC